MNTLDVELIELTNLLSRHNIKKQKVLFLSGSSGVGKTSLIKKLTTMKYNGHPIRVEYLSARVVREAFGNPSWEDIEKDPLSFQVEVMEHFKEMILDVFGTKFSVNDGLIVFERSLFDIVGYTYAYLYEKDLKERNSIIAQHLHSVIKFFTELSTQRLNIHHVLLRPDHTLPYEKIEARPSERIRNYTDYFLYSILNSKEPRIKVGERNLRLYDCIFDYKLDSIDIENMLAVLEHSTPAF